jgi:DNA-binding MarR family transcriptional regulator
VPTRHSDPTGNTASPLSAVKADEITWVLRDVFREYVETNAKMGERLHLSVNDLNAIELLIDNSELGPVELGHRLGIKSASATAMVDRLEEAGHLQRRPHATDRRRRTLEVTTEATHSLMQTIGPLIHDLSSIAEALSPKNRVVVGEYLQAVVDALRKHAEPQ